jgi:hypothetical protein
MPAEPDPWYVRLPDGRTLRARSLDALRGLLRGGRVPWESRARRSGTDDWQPLLRHAELSDLRPGDGRADVPETRASANGRVVPPLGVRGLVDELLSAFDSSLQRAKWACAAVLGLTLAVGWIVLELFGLYPNDAVRLGGQLGTAALLLVLFSTGAYILTRMTAIELAHLRSARLTEIRDGMARQVTRLTLALGLVLALVLGLMFVLRSAPDWLDQVPVEEAYAPVLEIARAALAVARLLVELLGWPVLGLALLLLGPILVVEDASLGQGLRDWGRIVRQHVRRLYVYESLALALAAVMTLPLLVSVLLTGSYLAEGRGLYLVEQITLRLLGGVALTPLLAYLLVANVFIYVNLRYEFISTPREK